MTRREFTLESALALLAGATITISACGGGGSSSPTSPSPSGQAAQDVSGSVSANHGHAASITGTQITARGAVMLNIQGGATHPHTVELSADEVTRIGARQQVSKQSTTDDGHSHLVTFN